jgi:hypothetical protein
MSNLRAASAPPPQKTNLRREKSLETDKKSPIEFPSQSGIPDSVRIPPDASAKTTDFGKALCSRP